ncbi:hypothetical protein P154DRAFT_517144 [Amniculicola lignicola CBS 123094]|uniref:Uncharacterized protein n=1 Tax=Amniculicola lignicola CBS 123094 TaxID=1392246 RepID=A0A6A5X3B7_9PLEO|nr:hypothetical protein P154DRAFT_517144 [Amniculicola lignicola CBS 123094]
MTRIIAGIAPLVSIWLLLIKLMIRGVDQDSSSHKAKYFTNVWYFCWNALLLVLSIIFGALGVAKNSLPCLIGSYQAALIHMTGLQIYLIQNLLPLQHLHWNIIQGFSFATQLTGGVLSILNTSPSFQVEIPTKLQIALLNVGGFGQYAVLGTRIAWTIGNLSTYPGVKQNKKH